MEASVGVQDGDELCCYYDEHYEDMPSLVSSSSSDALLERYLEPESPEGSDHGGVWNDDWNMCVLLHILHVSIWNSTSVFCSTPCFSDLFILHIFSFGSHISKPLVVLPSRWHQESFAHNCTSRWRSGAVTYTFGDVSCRTCVWLGTKQKINHIKTNILIWIQSFITWGTFIVDCSTARACQVSCTSMLHCRVS